MTLLDDANATCCYDEVKGMICPAMYAALGANLHLPYWVVSARGGYTSSLLVDPAILFAAATQALTWQNEPKKNC